MSNGGAQWDEMKGGEMKKRRAPNIPKDEADEIAVGEVLPQ